MKRLTLLALLLSVQSVLQAQHHRGHAHDSTFAHLPPSLGKNLNLGTFDFHARSFFMGTVNRGSLLDYHTMGIGAGLGYYSPSWKGFHIGFSGFFVFQLWENNIYEKDPTTGNGNRYEVLLYDMNDFHNKRDLDRLEELYLTYEKKHFSAVLGRQKFESPLMNEQDNRMRPNIFSGINLEYELKRWKFIAAAFHAVTIRGTVDWYSIQNSYGVYPFGRNVLGTPSEYKGNVKSAGIGVLGVKHHTKHGKSQVWNYFNENVFNLTFGQTEWDFPVKKAVLQSGLQGFYQTPINDGGNPDPLKSYIHKDEFAYGLGGKIGVKTNRSTFSVNYLHIGNTGRFLFPREWGREQFFASLPRERFEGSGDMHALTLKYKYDLTQKNLYAELGASVVDHSGLTDYSMNKYGIPSYYHFTALVDYKFKGFLDGLDIQFLAAYKAGKPGLYIPDQLRINRVDMWNFNLIIDYRF